MPGHRQGLLALCRRPMHEHLYFRCILCYPRFSPVFFLSPVSVPIIGLGNHCAAYGLACARTLSQHAPHILLMHSSNQFWPKEPQASLHNLYSRLYLVHLQQNVTCVNRISGPFSFFSFSGCCCCCCLATADKPKSQANWKAKHGFKYNLLCDPSFEVLKQLGVTKGAKGINRSHIIVEKGGKIKDVRVGISPKDSVAEAVKTCTS